MKLTAFAAITSWRELRHADSSAQSLLSDATESALLRIMNDAATCAQHGSAMTLPTELPEDIDALRALLLVERAAHAAVVAERAQLAVERDLLAVRTEKLEQIVAEMQRARFGRGSEKISDDQLALALEALETEHYGAAIKVRGTRASYRQQRNMRLL